MTREEKELALYCLKASSDYHSEVCEECINYPNCDHTIQDDVTETIIKALEQEPKTGQWKVVSDGYGDSAYICECSECKDTVWVYKDADRKWNYCPNCGAKMRG